MRNYQLLAEMLLSQHCPFLELAEVQRDLVCGLHFALMRGALEQRTPAWRR